MAEQVIVQFAGEGTGTAELTWGQRAIWTEIQYTGVSLSMGGVMVLAEGTTLDGTAEVLRYALSRHQSLRTRLRFDADGRARQELVGSGEIAMEVVDVAAGEDPAGVADDIRERYLQTNFDYANEWPVRMAVVRVDGTPTHAVVMYCHMAFDAQGFAILVKDLIQGQTGPQPPVTAVQPLELAAREQTPAQRRQSESALRHWERLLRAMPARRFRSSADRRSPRFWEASITSPAMRLAARSIAARTEVDAAPVLLAAFAVALARVTGINPVATQVLVSNRFRAGLADTVSPVMQAGLSLIDVGDITFDEAVTRAWQSSMAAYMNAYYDPERRDELVARVGRERGEEVDISCFYNDRRRPTLSTGDIAAPTAADIRAALPLTELKWLARMDRVNRTLFFHVDEEPDALHVMMCVDTHYVGPADLEAILRGYEEVLVGAALDPAATTGVPYGAPMIGRR